MKSLWIFAFTILNVPTEKRDSIEVEKNSSEKSHKKPQWNERKTEKLLLLAFFIALQASTVRIELEKKSGKESFDELNESPSEKAQRNSSVQKNKFAVFPNEIRWKRVQQKKVQWHFKWR